MKIKRFSISGYRSLHDVTVDFDDLTVFVGRNDAGKSNIMQAVDMLLGLISLDSSPTHDQFGPWGSGGGSATRMEYSGTVDYRLFEDDKPGTIKASLTLDISPEEWKGILHQQEPWQVRRKSWNSGNIGGIEFEWEIVGPKDENKVRAQAMRIASEKGLLLYSRRASGEETVLGWSKDSQLTYGTDQSLLEGLRTVLFGKDRKILTRFMIIPADRNLLPDEDWRRSEQTGFPPDREVEPGTIPEAIALHQDSVVYAKKGLFANLNRDLRMLFPYYEGVRSLKEIPGGRRDIFFDAYPSTQIGGGVKQILVCLYRLRTKEADIVAVEEPEIHLHPAMQREFFRYIRELTRGRQLIITTHSPSIVAESPLESIRLVRGSPGKTEVVPLTIPRIQGVIDELGIAPRDIFEFESVLIVEGKTDCLYFEEVTRRFRRKNPASAQVAVIDAGGWGNVDAYANAALLKKLRRHYLVVFDGDTKQVEAKRKAREVFITRSGLDKRALITLERPNIEHYYAFPKSLARSFSDLDFVQTSKILANASKRRDLKQELQRLFMDQMKRGFTLEDVRKIIHGLRDSEFPSEIWIIAKRIAGGQPEGSHRMKSRMRAGRDAK